MKNRLTRRTLKYMGVKSNPNVDAMVTALEDFAKAGDALQKAYEKFQEAYHKIGEGDDGKITPETFVANAGGRTNADKINNFNRGFWSWWQGQYGESYYSMSKELIEMLKKV